MAIDPSVVINLAAEFTGADAFRKAGKQTSTLEKNVKKLGRTIGLTFSTAAVLAYSKASVKAAAADIKAQKQLALSLKNVGLERDAATAEGYIQRLESELGIIDDKLRPAYASLAIATKDTAETQRILGIALDISASTGKDLEAVVAALSKAYLGNNTTLSKLGIGIAKADLKTKSFKEITDQLAVTFAGSAKASADSFAGSIDKLSIASNNAKEIIGTSLINALQSLGEDKSIDGLGTSIENAAKSLANFIDSIVYLKGEIASIPGANIVSGAFGLVSGVLGKFSPQRLAELVKAIKGFQGMGNVAMTGGSNMDTQKYEAAQKKILADQKKLAAAKIKADKLAAAAKVKADKLAAENAAKLAKAGAMFDLDKIQIEAALKGKITDEESLRLRLQQAILNEDAVLAEKLQKQLEASQRATAALQGQINGIKPLADPFAEWLTTLEGIASTLSKILGMPINTSSSILNPNPNSAVGGPGAGTQTPETIVPADPIPVVVVPDPTPIPATNNSMAGLGGNAGGFGFSLPSYLQNTIPQAPVTVVVNNNGTTLLQDEFVKVVGDALIVANTNGQNNYRPGAVPPEFLGG
jgi:hypothetical protein